MLAPSYIEAHRYDGAVVQHDRREALVPCVIQPRDVSLVRDIWRYKFMTAPQILELWWPDRAAWSGQRRLLKLFRAGLLERFRPMARRGSYPWTYHLGSQGHRLLQGAGYIPPHLRYRPRAIYDFGHVLHELQLNAWVLALKRAAPGVLLRWEGETDIEPPPAARRSQVQLGGDWSAEGLRDSRPRLLRPDAVLELRSPNVGDVGTWLIEYDRTRRLDKNFDKFRRYDAFLCWWWRRSVFAEVEVPPFVLFICQDASQRELFLSSADHELTGHHWHPSAATAEHEYAGRRRILFAVEHDAHGRDLHAWQLPAFPPGHPARTSEVHLITFAA